MKKKQVTFDETTAPPQEPSPIIRAAFPTPLNITRQSLTELIIDKPISTTPTPRVQATNETPIISAGPAFDYNKMPLAPLRCAVQMFKSRDRHGMWAEHTTNEWYIGTSSKHY
jgi:hypothetical protein